MSCLYIRNDTAIEGGGKKTYTAVMDVLVVRSVEAKCKNNHHWKKNVYIQGKRRLTCDRKDLAWVHKQLLQQHPSSTVYLANTKWIVAALTKMILQMFFEKEFTWVASPLKPI